MAGTGEEPQVLGLGRPLVQRAGVLLAEVVVGGVVDHDGEGRGDLDSLSKIPRIEKLLNRTPREPITPVPLPPHPADSSTWSDGFSSTL